jgi:hypothetical protein
LVVALAGDNAFSFVQRGEEKRPATLQWKEKVSVALYLERDGVVEIDLGVGIDLS